MSLAPSSEGRLRSAPEPAAQVVLAVTGQGNQAAAVIAERAITMYSPQALLFVGVAGGLHEDLRIGDVVVATRVYAYHGGMETDAGFLTRPRSWEAPYGLEQLARHLDLSGHWLRWLPPDARDDPPTVHFRPIAAGEVLLDSRDSDLARRIHRSFNDAAVIEMESAGAAHAGHLRSVPVLTIRGISDLADGGKTDADAGGSQAVAAANAAAFAAALIDALTDASDPEFRIARDQDASSDVADDDWNPPQLPYLLQKTDGFVGRDFAFARFKEFREAHPCGHILVEGLPGVGKTSLLAQEVRRQRWPAHFNIGAQGIDSPAAFLDHLHAQLSSRYRVGPPPVVGDDADGRYLNRLLHETAGQLGRGEQLMIVVDALDEVSQRRADLNPLFLPTMLPAGVYLIVSRRVHTAPLRIEGPSDVVDLMAHGAETRRDAEAFIRASLAKPEVRARLGDAADDVDLVVATLLERSQLNFMYLMYVMRDIADGRMRPGDLRHPPLGLRGYYERHWQSMLSRGAGAALGLRTIYTLAKLRKPVTASLLASVLRVDQVDVVGLLEDWAQFLAIAPRDGVWTYSFYHQDFCDFLMDQRTVSAARVDLTEISAMIGRGLVEGLGLRLDE